MDSINLIKFYLLTKLIKTKKLCLFIKELNLKIFKQSLHRIILCCTFLNIWLRFIDFFYKQENGKTYI